ncbi:hypothetical protein CYY_009531, partial [Polysphondylium violaceum]
MNKIDGLYRFIFNNVILSRKIFAYVHKIQYYRRSLRYDDIVDINWMIKYNHLSLLREKLNNGSTMFVKGDVFSISNGYHLLINKDFELFKRVFERYKYDFGSLELFDILDSINNLEAVKWIYESGYGRKIQHLVFTKDSNPEILRYLIENNWFQVLHDSLLKDVRVSKKSTYTPEILQVFKEHMSTPITSEQAKEIIVGLLKNPIPLMFEYLSPLFQENIGPFEVSKDFHSSHLSNYPIIEYLIEKKLCQDESFLKPIYDKLK